MGILINHNLMALNAANNLTMTYGRLAKSVSRLSSGLRITTASDDAAGLAVRELMRSDIRVLNQGIRNAQDAINMLMTADGALSVIDEKLIRMKELAEQSATGTYSSTQRTIMNNEFQAMADEITRIANATDFNGIKLLDGSLSLLNSNQGLKVHFGTGNDSTEDYYFVSLGDATAEGLGINSQTSTLTGTYNFSSQTDQLNLNGYFGFYYDTGNDSSYQLSEVGSIVRITSSMSLTDIKDQINLGINARGKLVFSGNVSNGDILNIGGLQFEFAESAGALTGTSTILLDMSDSTATAASAASLLTAAVNSREAAAVWAVQSGAAVYLFAKTGDGSGNAIAVSSTNFANNVTLDGSSVETAGGQNLSNGGTNWATATIVQGTSGTSTVYNLKLTGVDLQSSGGTGTLVYRLRAINFNADNGFSTSIWTTAGVTGLDNSGSNNYWSQTYQTTAVDISTQSGAQAALLYLDSAIEAKDSLRAEAGYKANRLQNTITNLTIQAEMLQSSEAAISDADVAMEMTEFTRNMILAQSGVAMLAQANSIANLALSLLGG